MRSFLTPVLAAALVLTGSVSATAQPGTNQQPQAQHSADLQPRTNAPCTPSPRFKKNDFRGMWIASVVNIDWPSRRGLSAQAQQRQLTDWYDLAVKNNFNAVVVQVRPTADTFWPSTREPWSRWLTGKQGQDPGYDPLAFAVEQAHARGLEMHAWYNPYRVTMGPSLNTLTPDHPARQNRDWVVRKDGKWYYDPGHPDARAHVIETIMETVDRYDLDGVHFDDYFYPYPGSGRPFNDTKTFRQYGQGFAKRADWRRHNVDLLIKELSDRIRASKPGVQFGVSPFAVWRNKATDPEGSDTRAGVQNYDQLFADTRKWVREGWIDYIAPQIYWTRGFTVADYEKITRWWANEIDVAKANGHNVGLYIGEATYRAGTNTTRDWRKPNVLVSHRRFSRNFPQVNGAIYFSAKDVKADRRKTTTRLVNRFYSRPALTPIVGNPSGPAPQAPTGIRNRNGQITWAGADPNTVRYAIYQVPATASTDCAFADARHLAAVIPAKATNQWTTRDSNSQVFISAIDRWGRESQPAKVNG
jgi:uncharacterized lipoprotein YddW (UPF0748 family)